MCGTPSQVLLSGIIFILRLLHFKIVHYVHALLCFCGLEYEWACWCTGRCTLPEVLPLYPESIEDSGFIPSQQANTLWSQKNA